MTYATKLARAIEIAEAEATNQHTRYHVCTACTRTLKVYIHGRVPFPCTHCGELVVDIGRVWN